MVTCTVVEHAITGALTGRPRAAALWVSEANHGKNAVAAWTADRTSAAVGLIQPAMIVIIALVVGFLAVSLVSAMYSIYGEFGA